MSGPENIIAARGHELRFQLAPVDTDGVSVIASASVNRRPFCGVDALRYSLGGSPGAASSGPLKVRNAISAMISRSLVRSNLSLVAW